MLEPVVARYRDTVKRRYFRGDAAFANSEIYEFLEAEGYGYAIRLPTNPVLQGKIGYLLKRPVGRPPREERFDRLTDLAKEIFGVNMALITIVDSDRQWFKSTCGLDGISETPRDAGFCAHAIFEPEGMVVPD